MTAHPGRSSRTTFSAFGADGRCVLFSSHIMQEVSALCDRIIIISGGRIVAFGTPEQIKLETGHDNLEDAFVALSGLDELQA